MYVLNNNKSGTLVAPTPKSMTQSGRKITLCGSTGFKAAFKEWNVILTLQGNVVYSIAVAEHGQLDNEQKDLLDLVHKEKIKNSDEIFVLDLDEYIGESTTKEIIYASRLGKVIKYLSVEYPKWTVKDCKYITVSA